MQTAIYKLRLFIDNEKTITIENLGAIFSIDVFEDSKKQKKQTVISM